MLENLFDKLIHGYELHARRSLLRTGFVERTIPTRLGALAVLDGDGDGRTPLMLIHGLSSESVHYAKLIRGLRAHVGRIIVPDLPAHGVSDAPPPNTSANELREALIEAFDQLIDEPVVIFGNSMGGLAALQYALARPSKVRGLILCSPAGAAMNAHELSQLLAQFRLKSYGDALDFVDRLLVDPTLLRRMIAWGVKRKFDAPQLQALIDVLGPRDLLTPADLHKVAVPTLLYWGEDDRILPRSSFDFFAKHLPPSTIVERPPRMSHSPYLEDPDGVATRIAEFVAMLENAERRKRRRTR